MPPTPPSTPPARPPAPLPGEPRTGRTPRYLRFLVTGALAGLLAATVLVLVRGDLVDSPTILFLYLSLVLSGVGALLGAVVAVLLEARRRGVRAGSP